MKVRPSHQPGHVVFDVSSRDMVFLAGAGSLSDVISTVVEEEISFREQLNERASKQTRLLEEILARSQLLVSLEIKRSMLHEENH